MSHKCPAARCKTSVPSIMLVCPRHWRMLPKPIAERAAGRKSTCLEWDHFRGAASRVIARAAVILAGLEEGVRPEEILQALEELKAFESH